MIDRSLNYGRPIIRRFLEKARPYREVLDLGAGKGVDLLCARLVEPGARLHAIDTDARRIKALAGMGVHAAPLDIERDRLPFADGALDVVIANQILEHTKEIFWIFHEIARVLGPEGKLLLGVPNLASLHNRLLLLCGRQPSVIRTASAHVRGFTHADLVQFLQLVWPGGLVVRARDGANFYPFPPLLARPLARAFPGLAWGLFLLLQKQREYSSDFLDFPRRAGLETNFYTGGGAT